MNISPVTIQGVVAYRIGNILKNEGIDSGKPMVRCSAQARKHLGRLVGRLFDKCTPYVGKRMEDGFSAADTFATAIQSEERMLDKSLQLATRLYESGRHLQIPASTLLTLSFTYTNDDGDTQQGIALIAFSHDEGSLIYNSGESGKELDYADCINEHSLERVAIWHQESGKVRVLEKKNTPVKFWIDDFLHLKPVLTDSKAATAASQWIKKVSEQIDSAREASEYKRRMSEMLGQASSVSFDDIEACSRQYLDEETLGNIRERIEKQTNLSLQGAYELPAEALHQKVRQFVKTMRLTPKLDVTIKGRQEVISMEQLDSDEEDAIVIKLKLKEEE